MIKAILAGIGMFALIAFFTLIFAYPLMWAINYLIAPGILQFLFGVTTMTFWKTFCLSYVAGSLFKSVNTK